MAANPTWVKERESKHEDLGKQERKSEHSLFGEFHGSLEVAPLPKPEAL